MASNYHIKLIILKWKFLSVYIAMFKCESLWNFASSGIWMINAVMVEVGPSIKNADSSLAKTRATNV
jgi:hypothetical protein